jgi:hypothetical protein
MEENHLSVDETATMVLLSTIDARCVDSMKLIAESTNLAEEFVRSLVSRKVEGGESLDIALPETQQLFERIADFSETTACIFMAHLWPIAGGQIGMHDVCNAIDLWLAHNTGSQIADHLKYIASSDEDEGVRRHFRQIASGRP